MVILAFDTTGERGGIGIFRDEEPLTVVANVGPANIYSVTLFQMLERALETAGLSLHEIDLFAVANGPGSFTGIRVGVAAAQGLSTAFKRPVKAVSTLEAMVEEARSRKAWVIPLLDARRGDFFLGTFHPTPDDSSNRPTRQGEGIVIKKEALLPFLSDFLRRHSSESRVECLIREHDHSALAVRSEFGEEVAWRIVPGVIIGAIARLAFRAARAGDVQSPGEIDACYIRRSDAELELGEKRSQGPA